jgi:iron complex outermembrane receptor protein
MRKRNVGSFTLNIFLPIGLRTALLAGLSLLAPGFQVLSAEAQQPAAPLPREDAKSSTASERVQHVSTTVVVEGAVSDDYLPTAVTVGNLDQLPLLLTPASATVTTRDLMNDQVSRLLSDVIKNDASVGEDYAPVGYYGDFQIRGFPIDLATGLQINGMVIAGEQDVPLENKERVEVLKGIAGAESGVTSAGGLINYVTKRPAMVKTLETATDHRGTAYASIDLGQLFGSKKQFGLRTNLAGEKIKSYVEDANGWRAVGTTATDWKLSDRLFFRTDFEYQHKVERSEAGYQLLGGTVVPDHVYPSVMLGDQPWSKPNTFDTFNSGGRLDVNFPLNWKVYVEGSYSHSLIDDNVIYPYGCYYEAECNVAGGPAPYFFAPDGTYDIYDYRDPGELRTDGQGQAIAFGSLKTHSITNNLVFGGSLFHRVVDLPGAPSMDAPGTVQYGAVDSYLGSENIYQPNILYPIESPQQQAGPVQLADFNHQVSGIVQDRITLPKRIQLTAGGRYASVTDFNYTGAKGVWLPQYSATYAPRADLMVYGNYNVLLSLGPQAPFWADNGSVYLAPYFTRQAEAGAKFEPSQRILLTTAVFHMRSPFFYPRVISTADNFCVDNVSANSQCFESEGHETHNGIEFGAQGKAANWIKVSATAAGILAKSSETGTAEFNDKQVINVPRFRSTVFADIALPRISGSHLSALHLSDLHLLPGWTYSGRKEATRDDAVSVPGYHLLSLGARMTPGGEQGRVTLRLFADNLLDKHYWKDTGANYGDTFIHLGAPTTVRLSGQYRF